MVWLFCAAIAAGVFRSPLSVGLIAAIAFAMSRYWHARASWLVAPLVLVCSVVGWAARERAEADRDVVAHVAAGTGAARSRLEGWVCGFPQTGRYGTTFDFATTIERRPVRLAVRAACFDVSYGESLALDARLVTTSRVSPSFFLARGIAGEARVRFEDVRRTDRVRGCPLLRGLFWRMHRAARTQLVRSLGNESALSVGLLLGERGTLDRSFYESVRKLGIVHLLALSGMHLTMIAALAVLAARAMPRWRDGIVALALSLYVGMVGDVDSLTRAYAMALLVLAARACVRPVRAVDALGKALFVMLLMRPCSILSVGLQLSFAATLAVLLCVRALPPVLTRPPAKTLSTWRRGVVRVAQGAANALLISIAVELFIAPLQLHHFGRMSVVGPLATVVFMVPVSVLQVVALIVSIDLPFASAHVAAWLAWMSVATRDAIVLAGRIAPAPIVFAEPNWILYYTSICAVCLFRKRAIVWWIAALGIGLSFIARCAPPTP